MKQLLTFYSLARDAQSDIFATQTSIDEAITHFLFPRQRDAQLDRFATQTSIDKAIVSPWDGRSGKVALG